MWLRITGKWRWVDEIRNINDVVGILIGKDCSEGVKAITRQFKFLKFMQYELKIGLEVDTTSYIRVDESVEKDYVNAIGAIADYIREANQEEKDMEEYFKNEELKAN